MCAGKRSGPAVRETCRELHTMISRCCPSFPTTGVAMPGSRDPARRSQNARTRVCVEVLGDGQQPIPGYTEADCVPLPAEFSASAQKYNPETVQWRQREGLSALTGRTVSLRVHMVCADVFSLRIVEQPRRSPESVVSIVAEPPGLRANDVGLEDSKDTQQGSAVGTGCTSCHHTCATCANIGGSGPCGPNDCSSCMAHWRLQIVYNDGTGRCHDPGW